MKAADVYRWVRRVPPGRVTTYGAIAALVGTGARQVGYALAALPAEADVPWHRVVNARGEISRRSEPQFEGVQRELLIGEGVRPDERGRIDLAAYGWTGAGRRSRGG